VIYEQVRAEALQQNGSPPSWALERVRRYGVVGLFPSAKHDLPFILYAQSVPRLAWSGKRDVQRETLHRVFACLITVGAARPDSETIEPIIDTVDTSGVLDATVEDVHALDTAHGVNHASSLVCSGFQ
jgi:hypothetical protein